MSAPSSFFASLPRRFAPAFFGLWLVVICVFGAWAIAQHAVPIPAAAVVAQQAGPLPSAWHILGANCGCSASVAQDLAHRGPQPGWTEKVCLVGSDPALAASLRKAGFNVELTDAEILAKTQGVQGAPWLVLYFPDGRIGYSGGYAAARPGTPGTSNRAETLMAAVAQGETVKSLPSFGCATSQALRAQLDPVGLRYPATAATTANFTPTPNPPPL